MREQISLRHEQGIHCIILSIMSGLVCLFSVTGCISEISAIVSSFHCLCYHFFVASLSTTAASAIVRRWKCGHDIFVSVCAYVVFHFLQDSELSNAVFS